jgi:hypothetical protein
MSPSQVPSTSNVDRAPAFIPGTGDAVFYKIQAVAALTTVKIVELLFEWGKRFSAGYAEASRSLPVFLSALQAGHMNATI